MRVVVIGEATAGEAPQPQRGERLGRPGAAFKADIAVDPVEGTSYLVRGLTNALAVLAVAPRGAMMNPGPAFYMEKFVAAAPARGKIDPPWPTAKKLEELAEGLRQGRLRPHRLRAGEAAPSRARQRDLGGGRARRDVSGGRRRRRAHGGRPRLVDRCA